MTPEELDYVPMPDQDLDWEMEQAELEALHTAELEWLEKDWEDYQESQIFCL
jgi:hypothetical protein